MKGLNVVQELGYIGLGRQEGAGTDVGGGSGLDFGSVLGTGSEGLKARR